MRITIVAAVAKNRVIGADGRLPWRIRADMRQFRALTIGHPVIMGRKTFDSLEKPLSDRTNIVVTRDRDFRADGAIVAGDVAAALDLAKADAERRGKDEVFIIGGGEIYRQIISRADRLIITRVDIEPLGDSVFPVVSSDWQVASRIDLPHADGDTARGEVVVYVPAGNVSQ